MSSRLLPRLVALLAVAGAALSFTVVPAVQASPGACGRSSGCTAFELQHAGSTFGWYPAASRFEFKGGVPSAFRKSGRGAYTTRSGMLELRATHDAKLSTTWKLSARTGRWETRFRTDQIGGPRSAANYTVKIAMVPPPSASHCGGQGITVLSYHPSKPRTARFEVKTLPQHTFTKTVRSARPIGDDQWHTVAVEVTRKRISFYLDAKAVAKENRPAALLDVPLRMRFSLVPQAGRAMKDTRLNLDWARYWTLRKAGRNQAEVRHAPLMTRTANPTAC